MMLSLAFVSVLLTAVSGLEASSSPDKIAKLMSEARELGGNNNNNNFDYSWVQNYSVRFQSCSSITQFNTYNNNNNNNNNYGALNKANVALFKLCPTKDCSAKCVGAEYVVSTETFANYYTDSLMTTRQYTCETIRQNCVCEDGTDDNVCQASCYTASNATYCVSMNNNNFNIQNYMQCGKVKLENNNNNNNGGNNNGNNNVFYAAPKCASDGNSIIMGLFTDQYCTYNADSSAYELFASNYGFSLPHANSDLVEENCVSCSYANGNYFQTSAMCSYLYVASAKCEANLQGQISAPITTGCSYISEIPTKADGYVTPKPSHAATIFFALTTFSLLGLLIYVSFKAGIVRKKIDLGTSGLMA